MVIVTESPVVSVVMAVYNEDSRITAAIQSIIDQTFQDWELVVIDDGSSDRTSEILNEFKRSDDRVKVITNETNKGLAVSLNRGVECSRGKYIARMDADDISYPNRLELQVEYLDAHPEIAVIGGNADFVDEEGRYLSSSKMPSTPQEIKRILMKMNPLIHPSVMFRREFFLSMGGYDNRLRKKQDYDLWLRGFKKYDYANLNEVVIRYTVEYSKPFVTDLYGFYVHCLNAYRQRCYVSGFFWASVTLGVNIMRKLGYRQKSYRSDQ